MKIDYVSSAMYTKDFATLFSNFSKIPGQQAQKYNRLMMEGLLDNGVKIRAVTARPITTKNSNKIFYKAKTVNHNNIHYHYCSLLNLKGVKIIWQAMVAFVVVLFGNANAVVADILNASAAFGAIFAANIRRIPAIGIVTDLPELMVTGTNPRYADLVYRIANRCTGFVLLTESMNGVINPNRKPYVVIEALCDSSVKNTNDYHMVNKGIRKCVYAGLLDARYGVKNMVEGFIFAAIPDAELHIYGNGPYAEELQRIVKENSNIIYHGVVMNEEVVLAEREAILLINPRPNDEAFTKYSFPSKVIEYMNSGTATITTRLSGIPEEYYEYMFVFEKENSEGIAIKLAEILSLSDEELKEFGKKAKEFVISEKNCIQQTKKLINLIRKVIK